MRSAAFAAAPLPSFPNLLMETQWLWVEASHLQWRHRAGLSPASLLCPRGHPKTFRLSEATQVPLRAERRNRLPKVALNALDLRARSTAYARSDNQIDVWVHNREAGSKPARYRHCMWAELSLIHSVSAPGKERELHRRMKIRRSRARRPTQFVERKAALCLHVFGTWVRISPKPLPAIRGFLGESLGQPPGFDWCSPRISQ